MNRPFPRLFDTFDKEGVNAVVTHLQKELSEEELKAFNSAFSKVFEKIIIELFNDHIAGKTPRDIIGMAQGLKIEAKPFPSLIPAKEKPPLEELEERIKEGMHDPESYEHVRTTIVDDTLLRGYQTIWSTVREIDHRGAQVITIYEARVSPKGVVFGLKASGSSEK